MPSIPIRWKFNLLVTVEHNKYKS